MQRLGKPLGKKKGRRKEKEGGKGTGPDCFIRGLARGKKNQRRGGHIKFHTSGE